MRDRVNAGYRHMVRAGGLVLLAHACTCGMGAGVFLWDGGRSALWLVRTRGYIGHSQ